MSWSTLISDTARLTLGGGGRADLLQDYIGARALVLGGNAYPALGPAVAAVGVDWPVSQASTHPPTAFVFLLPLAGLPWPVVAQIWVAVTIVCLVGSAWAFGLAPRVVLLISPLVLWPPVLTSAAQLTAIWLLCLSLAWRYRDKPFVAGAVIGVAALTKVTPALALLPFIKKRAWGAVGGALLVTIAGIAMIVCLDSHCLGEYLSVRRDIGATISSPDNGALLTWSVQVNPLLSLLAALGVGWALALLLRRPLDLMAWHGWTWLTVAVLPIAWTYSLLPLLPAALFALNQRRLAACALGVGVLALPWLSPLPSVSPISVALPIALAGETFIVLDWLQRHGRL